MTNEKLKVKLSLTKETLREVSDSQVDVLDQIVGGTGCNCTYLEARSAPPPCDNSGTITY
ncbi:hypothetical protein [Archangium sp.]|jgi:hypothetical protein|uniref:hypothetical protein n=1 Tax=Archangium sp. TaxID=1872627 RepID=UPI002ED8BB80